MGIRVIVTGATGMVGEGVLLECLASDGVAEVLAVNRRPLARTHAKLREIVHADFFDLAPIVDQLVGYDACFFCLGVSSVGVRADAYRRTTYDLTLHLAETLARADPATTFCYVSGLGTDGTERGRSRWARVKGETENALMRLLPHAYAFRPGFIRATPGQRNLPLAYRLTGWTFPLARAVWPAGCCTAAEIGRAMIRVAAPGDRPRDVARVIEVPDIVRLAKA